MTLRVGIISANWGAFAHLPAWRSLPGVEVVGICTSRRETAEAAAKKFNIARPFWNAEEMAADPGIDIVDCGTRPNLRHAMVLAALRHGKHVYNGIPCAANIDQARELRDAWKASGKVAIVDAFSQWLPAHQYVKEMIDQDHFGRLLGGSCFFNLSLFNAPNPYFPYNWFAQAGQGVSAMRNLGSHALHMLVFLFGEIEELTASDNRVLDEWRFPDGKVIRPETNDYVCLILRFKSGLVLQLQVSWSATLGSGWLLDAFGARGRFISKAPSFPTSRDTTLQAGSLGGSLQPVDIPARFTDTPDIGITADVDPQPAYPMALSMRRMIDAICGGGPAAPDFDQAWKVEQVLEAARRSSAERRWIRPQDIV